jgi:hypothetical protein
MRKGRFYISTAQRFACRTHPASAKQKKRARITVFKQDGTQIKVEFDDFLQTSPLKCIYSVRGAGDAGSVCGKQHSLYQRAPRVIPGAVGFLKDHQEVLVPCEGSPTGYLLPAAIIYGPNASGKTNVVNAARFLKVAVVNSQIRGTPDGGVPRQAFALDDRKQAPTTLEIEFVTDGVRFQYGFEATDRAFIGEWLYWFPHRTRQVLFERTDEKTIRFGRKLKGQNKIISELMRPNSLFLSAAAQNSHEQLSRVHGYLVSMSFEAPPSDPRGSELHTKKEEYDRRIIDFLAQIGTGVVGYRIKKPTISEKQQAVLNDIHAALTRHLGPEEKLDTIPQGDDYELELAHSSKKNEPVYFSVNRESAGTRRLLLILSSVFSALDAGTVVFIDELDASLHTQICEGIVALFSNRRSNPRGAQLIATTHDTNLMRSRHLRRDQLWFTEKDQSGATHLFPLSDIRTRKTDDIEKGYLEGRFGAIPFAGNLPDLLRD